MTSNSMTYVVRYIAKRPDNMVVIDETQSFKFIGDKTKFERMLEDRAKKKGAFRIIADVGLSN